MLSGVWCQVLGRDEVSESESFFEQGGDSLALLEAVTAAHARGLIVPPALLAEGRSIAEIAAWLEVRSGQEGSPADPPPGALGADVLRAEADEAGWSGFLRAARSRTAAAPVGPPRSVLFTGGTGHLGSCLLAALLGRTEAEFHVLVRCADPREGRRRLLAALAGQDVELPEGVEERLLVVPGDVEHPLFGLTRSRWEVLANRVDTVYHNAACVNLVAPYASLRGTNVEGTREVVRFQGTGPPKRLHFASTLSVFVATDRNRGRLREDDGLEATRYVFGGYAQTKWAAEWLVRTACPAAGPVAIYRLGLITGDSRTGRASPHDFLTTFYRGLARVGCVPRLVDDLALDVTPVDFAAAAMAHLSLAHRPPGRRRRPSTSPTPGRCCCVNWSMRCGGGVFRSPRSDPTPFGRAWPSRSGSTPTPLRPAWPSAACWPGAAAFNAYRTMDLLQATGVEFACDAARAGLEGSGVDWPAPGRELLERYLAHGLDPDRAGPPETTRP